MNLNYNKMNALKFQNIREKRQEMIFHPNGNLNGSWVDDEDILLAYNPYKS